MLLDLKLALLQIPDDSDSAQSSARSYSSAGHDGLTDTELAEWESSRAPASAIPVCPPATPATCEVKTSVPSPKECSPSPQE